MNSWYLSSDLNLHFQLIRILAEKSRPSVTVKTTWVSWLVWWQVKLVQWTTVPLRTQRKQCLSPLLGSGDITVWFTGRFPLFYSFLGTIKALRCYTATCWKKQRSCTQTRKKAHAGFQSYYISLYSKEVILLVYLHIPYLYDCSFMIPWHLKSSAIFYSWELGRV